MGKKRKTREQKIIADLRRKLAKVEIRNKKGKREVSYDSTSIPASLALLELRRSGPAGGPTPTSPPPALLPTVYLRKDLTRTLTLAILAISLELVIYFLTR